MQAILLPAHDHDTRRPHRKAPQVRVCSSQVRVDADVLGRYNPAERDKSKATM